MVPVGLLMIMKFIELYLVFEFFFCFVLFWLFVSIVPLAYEIKSRHIIICIVYRHAGHSERGDPVRLYNTITTPMIKRASNENSFSLFFFRSLLPDNDLRLYTNIIRKTDSFNFTIMHRIHWSVEFTHWLFFSLFSFLLPVCCYVVCVYQAWPEMAFFCFRIVYLILYFSFFVRRCLFSIRILLSLLYDLCRCLCHLLPFLLFTETHMFTHTTFSFFPFSIHFYGLVFMCPQTKHSRNHIYYYSSFFSCPFRLSTSLLTWMWQTER